MKSFTVAAATAVLAFASSAFAQEYNASKPFYLVLKSKDSKYDGQALGSSHIGAGIEELSPSGKLGEAHAGSIYGFNTTSGDPNAANVQGQLTWQLEDYSEGFGFYSPISTNVALATFGLGGTEFLLFNGKDELAVVSNYNDAVVPPTDDKESAYYRWFICETNFEGYIYEGLNFVRGAGKPQNPTCTKVGVVRHWAQ